MKIKCFKCSNKAIWSYEPGKNNPDDYYCDEHVPRRCSCNYDENDIESKDDLGRSLPCIEYMFYEEGTFFIGNEEDYQEVLQEIKNLWNNNLEDDIWEYEYLLYLVKDYEKRRI